MTTIINGTTGVDKVQNGTIAQLDLTTNVAGNGPIFRVHSTSSQTLAVTNTVYDATHLTVEDYDSHNALSAGVFTAPVTGYYHLIAPAGATGSTTCNLFDLGIVFSNGYTSVGNLVYSAAASFTNFQAETSDIFYMPAGTTAKVTYRIVGTGTLSTYNARFSGYLARAA